MDKKQLLKLILSGSVEREKLPLLIKASRATGQVLHAMKVYKHDEEVLPGDLVTTHAGAFDNDPTAPRYTFAELEAFKELGVQIPVIIFRDSPPFDQILQELEKVRRNR